MDKQHKKQIKRYIAWGCVVSLVALLAVMPLLANRKAQEDGPKASILSTQAQTRDITTRIIGGGQLSGSGTEDITIPEEVLLTNYLVSNGDSIKKGDAIAKVDKVSVMLAMAEVQETLDYLSGQMARISTDTEQDEVTALAGGKVKVLYGKEGESVRDVMLRDGALAILSLTGRMAVDLELETEFSHMDKVQVLLSDGTKTEGRVESAVGGILTVSIEDDDYAIGEVVTVETTDDLPLGSGELYIHNPWSAAAYYGTITEVNAKVNDTVSAGRSLFRLEVSGHSSEFESLKQQRQDYEELMQELMIMHESGIITAPCDGFVTGVDTEGSFLLAAEEDSWFVQWLDNPLPENTGWRVIFLSDEVPDDSSEPDNSTEPENPTDPEPSTDPTDPSEPSESTEPSEPDAVTYTVTVGQVTKKGAVSIGHTYFGITDLSNVSTVFSASGSKETWPLSGLVDTSLNEYPGTASAGNILFRAVSSEGDTYYVFAAVAAPAQSPQGGGPSLEDAKGSLGSVGGMGGGYTAPVFEPYTLETLTVATVTSQEEMSLTISVDEQDITRLRIGQDATVTVEALPGQTFPATVQAINNTGTNDGGSSKFTARLKLGKTGDMLPGMNASAFLDMETAASVLTIPVAALEESGTQTLVYTSYDKEEERFGDAITVTTGLSDGEYVQILSGLASGVTVYYPYYDTLELPNTPAQGPGFP